MNTNKHVSPETASRNGASFQAIIACVREFHDRFGIPFNIIYGPKAPDGILLGELLRADMVETALIKAGMTR